MRVKWATIIISLLALTVSIAHVGWEVMKNKNESKRIKQGTMSSVSTMKPEQKGAAGQQ